MSDSPHETFGKRGSEAFPSDPRDICVMLSRDGKLHHTLGLIQGALQHSRSPHQHLTSMLGALDSLQQNIRSGEIGTKVAEDFLSQLFLPLNQVVQDSALLITDCDTDTKQAVQLKQAQSDLQEVRDTLVNAGFGNKN